MNNLTNILNIHIDNEEKSAVLAKTESLLSDGNQHYIVTPNPEIVIYSTTDGPYEDILNKADVKLPDGMGLKFASYLTEHKIKQRIKGVDFILDLCKIAEDKGCSVFLLGGQGDVGNRVAVVLKNKFSKLKVAEAENGGEIDENGKLQDEGVLDRINQSKPDILLVAFGAPKQEKFIANYLAKLPSVKLAVGVGGSFGFISGEIKRAPKLLRAVGLEWLWRLIIEPWRWKRIYTAVIKFPIVFLKWRFLVKPTYRFGVSLFILNDRNQVFLMHRARLWSKEGRSEVWQLPQEGMEKGESLEDNVFRGALEELGISKDKLEILGYSKDDFKYQLPADSQIYYRQKGQERKMAYLKFLGEDMAICDNTEECAGHKWVDLDKLTEEIDPVRKEFAEFALKGYYDLK